MVNSETKSIGKKTNALGINKIPETATLITIATACDRFINDVKGIRIVKFRDDTRSALIDFITPKQCETAKEMGDLNICGESFSLHYARSKETSGYDVSASEDKLYIKYPEGASESDVIKMLGNVSVSKPDNAKNFFFATCNSIDEQVRLIKAFDKRPIADGNLSVKVAIDKTRKQRFPVKKIAN